MNVCVIIITLSLSFLSIGLGILTKNDCTDKGFCDNINTTQCHLISILFECPKKCGVCNAKCKDYSKDCTQFPYSCSEKDFQKSCPYSCGVCKKCENLIDDTFCPLSLRGSCITSQDMRYSCQQLCGNCWCKDRIKDCKSLKSQGYCDNKNLIGCEKTCEICKDDL